VQRVTSTVVQRASPSGRVAVLTVRGELDLATSGQLRQALLTACQGSARLVVVDLREAPFLDSTAFGVLVSASRRLDALGRSLLVANVAPAPAKALRVLGLARYFGAWDVRGVSLSA
jgi:anti-sigma B factor antagonist